MAKIVILLFILLESANVAALYFFPGSRYANGLGVFHAWEKVQADPETGRFARYMANWVAGTKLIFLFLLAVIALTGDQETLRLTSGVMALAIAAFFWRMYPLARQMGRAGELTPANYDRVLGGMIAALVAAFLLGALL
jgi:hypothetical protein